MYLSTTDCIQHKFAPEEEGALSFHAMVDGYLGKIDAMGAAIVLTADHGMKPKHDAAGDPAVVYVQDTLDDWLGTAAARVILPITDPYLVHHGRLAPLPQPIFQRIAPRARSWNGLMRLTASCLLWAVTRRYAHSSCRQIGSATS